MSQQPIDLEAVRERLRARREELRTRLSAVRSDQRRTTEPLSLDSADRATQRENDDVVDAIGVTVEAELVRISGALNRIDAGTYGSCKFCGSPINPERLHAVPYAESCSGCEVATTSHTS